jgi:hypothetical protein
MIGGETTIPQLDSNECDGHHKFVEFLAGEGRGKISGQLPFSCTNRTSIIPARSPRVDLRNRNHGLKNIFSNDFGPNLPLSV